MRRRNKLLSLLLSGAMLCSCFAVRPVQAFAEDITTEEAASSEEAGVQTTIAEAGESAAVATTVTAGTAVVQTTTVTTAPSAVHTTTKRPVVVNTMTTLPSVTIAGTDADSVTTSRTEPTHVTSYTTTVAPTTSVTAGTVTQPAHLANESYEYTWDMAANEIKISCYLGTDPVVEFPAEIDGVPVTELELGLYDDFVEEIIVPEGVVSVRLDLGDHLKRISLPSTVESIRFAYADSIVSQAQYKYLPHIGGETLDLTETPVNAWYHPLFTGCDSLEEIHVAEGNPCFSSMDGVLFDGDGQTLLAYPKGRTETTYTIPDGVAKIYNYAFAYCNALTEVFIPDGVEEIGQYAFGSCDNLTRVTLPDSVTSIESGSFNSCENLEEITLPGNLSRLDANSFNNTAWYNSQPDGVLYLGTYAVGYKGEMPSDAEITLRDGTTGVFAGVFPKTISSVTLPDSLTVIGSNALDSCTALTEIILPEGLVTIGPAAFRCCFGLTEIEIPQNVTFIGESAFYGCVYLEKILLPEGVTSIGDGAFNSCKSLVSVEIPESTLHLGESLFSNCINLTSAVLPEGLTDIKSCMFSGCVSLERIDLPSSVTRIHPGAFVRCTSLSDIVLPETVEILDNAAFSGCTGLETVTIMNAACLIGDAEATFQEYTVLVAAEGSTAQTYAECYGRCFRIYTAAEGTTHETGDLDGNGVITISDATEVLTIYARMAVQLDVSGYTESQLAAADVNQDGTVNIRDATAILTYYAQTAASLNPDWADIIG